MNEYYVGRRLSFEGAPCTVRYYGPVDGTKGDWLGVEWDEYQGKGKHDGSHQGKRYFRCEENHLTIRSRSYAAVFDAFFLAETHMFHGSGLSDSTTEASFVRPSRPSDKPLSFLDALRKKYVSNEICGATPSEDQISISGKTVEEVGFEKIRKQLAILQELRFVILDGLCIAGVESSPGVKTSKERLQIRSQALSIIELDLSRNLLEEWSDVVGICSAMRSEFLRRLKLDGNLFRNLESANISDSENPPFPNVEYLSLRATHFSWQNIVRLLPQFRSLAVLNLSSNGLSTLQVPLPAPHLTTLDLSSNKIVSLWDIAPLTSLPKLERLSLRHNPISSLVSQLSKADSTLLSFPSLHSLDLTSTLLPTLSSLDPIPSIFPKLKSLLTTHTPLSNFPSSKLLTIARLPTLTELNYSPITAAERQNAELYYLSAIAKQVAAAANPAEELQILNEHPRWTELCKIHGEPVIEKKSTEQYAAGTLGARVTEFTFYMTGPDLKAGRKENSQYETDGIEAPPPLDVDPESNLVSKRKSIPRTVDVYRLKGIVGQLFGIRPLSCKLIWETGEWDPVGGREGDGWSVSEDDSSDNGDEGPSDRIKVRERDQERGRTKWERREMELVDGTREVGFWVEGEKARVRVELR